MHEEAFIQAYCYPEKVKDFRGEIITFDTNATRERLRNLPALGGLKHHKTQWKCMMKLSYKHSAILKK